MTTSEFDDIRPYYEEEIPAAMQRIAGSKLFPVLASFVYPGEPLETVRNRIAGYRNVNEFQAETMSHMNERIIANSIDEFSCSGLERLSPNEAYLFVSNHRDIVLDSSLLQYFLFKNGFNTTQITFGANLMINQLVIDIGKSNKMFRVERPGGSVKEFYEKSLHLSKYIRHVICNEKQSVWIAQRNGRTKNGTDATDQGVIKMFCMSQETDKIDAIASLHIVPVSISYEWESCDILKTLELYESRFIHYTKKPNEDLNSILTGIMQKKGRVHIELCEPISREELLPFDNMTKNKFHKAVAQIIDSRINAAYRLYPNNYIAHDILHGNSKFSDQYTPGQRADFIKRLQKLDRYESSNIDQLKEIFLGIYSNPIDNKTAETV